MFDVDVTTCVALFLTNILHLKPYVKKSQSQNCQESLVLLQFYSILQWKYKSYQSLVKKIRFFFTVEKYQFYSHLICIEFTACDKIDIGPWRVTNCFQVTVTLTSGFTVSVPARLSPEHICIWFEVGMWGYILGSWHVAYTSGSLWHVACTQRCLKQCSLSL